MHHLVGFGDGVVLSVVRIGIFYPNDLSAVVPDVRQEGADAALIAEVPLQRESDGFVSGSEDGEVEAGALPVDNDFIATGFQVAGELGEGRRGEKAVGCG